MNDPDRPGSPPVRGRVVGALGVPFAALVAWLVIRTGDRTIGQLAAPFGIAALLVLALTPGLVALGVLDRRKARHSSALDLPVVLLGSGVAAMVAFGAWLVSPTVGKAFSMLVLVVSMAVVGAVGGPILARHRDLVVALVAGCLVVTGFLGLAMLRGDYTKGAQVVAERFIPLPDSQIPLTFAQRIQSQEPLDTPVVSGWHTSDRPPLQTGYVLALEPIGTMEPVGYQLLGLALQSVAVASLVVLGRTLGLTLARSVLLVAAVIPTGFFFVQTVYVWPKMLAAGLVLTATALAIERTTTRQRWRLPVLVALVVLGGLAHGGALYGAIGLIPILWLRRRELIDRSNALAATAAAAAVYLPWLAYQRVVDPPGDRILKWHLAGITDLDDTRPALRSVLSSYRNTPLGTIVTNKLTNFRDFATNAPKLLEMYGARPWTDRAALFLIEHERLVPLWAPGLLVVCAPALVVAVWRSGVLRDLTVMWATGAVAWILLQWGPPEATTTLDHAPYATLIAMAAALGTAALTRWPRWAYRTVFGAQWALFAVLWIWYWPQRVRVQGAVTPSMVILLVGSAAALGALWWWLTAREATDPVAETTTA